MLRLNEKCIHLLRVLKENPSGRRHRDVGSGAVKELNSKILLERLDLETHSGLCEIQFIGGLAEAELFRNRPKDHETEVVETRH